MLHYLLYVSAILQSLTCLYGKKFTDHLIHGPSLSRRLGGGAKEVTPSTTARVDNDEVLRGCLGGGTYVSQPPRRANQGALKNGGEDTHTHAALTGRSIIYTITETAMLDYGSVRNSRKHTFALVGIFFENRSMEVPLISWMPSSQGPFLLLVLRHTGLPPRGREGTFYTVVVPHETSSSERREVIRVVDCCLQRVHGALCTWSNVVPPRSNFCSSSLTWPKP